MRHGAMHLGSNARLRSLSTGLMLQQIGVLHQGLDLVYDLAENVPPGWPDSAPLGKTDAESLAPPLQHVLQSIKAAVLEDRHARTVETEIPQGAYRQIFELTVSPDLDAENGLCGITTTVIDITEARERELALTNLLREVSHRSRNLLAIVQSMATQTGAHSQDMSDFLRKFRGRLQALAGTQDLVTDTDWRGALLHDLVAGQMSKLGNRASRALSISGDNPMLGPNAALHVGLAMHELAVNAVLHGALSRHPPGRITLHSVVDGERGDLVLDWREAGVDDGVAASAPQFGTQVLRRIVPAAVGGTMQYSIEPDAVRYRLTIPAGMFEN